MIALLYEIDLRPHHLQDGQYIESSLYETWKSTSLEVSITDLTETFTART